MYSFLLKIGRLVRIKTAKILCARFLTNPIFTLRRQIQPTQRGAEVAEEDVEEQQVRRQVVAPGQPEAAPNSYAVQRNQDFGDHAAYTGADAEKQTARSRTKEVRE
jgi:hypothetical protein